MTAAPDPRPDVNVSGPAPPPGIENVRRLTAHCRKCQHPIAEYLGDKKLVVGGLTRDRPTHGRCHNCGALCRLKPLCMGG